MNPLEQYIYTQIYTTKLSPTFLWVSKIDVKLGVVVKNSKLQQVGDFWFFGSKSALLPGVFLNQFSTKQQQCSMGRTDGTDGWDGDQKCLMGRMGRTDVKLEVVVKNFKITAVVTFRFLV